MHFHKSVEFKFDNSETLLLVFEHDSQFNKIMSTVLSNCRNQSLTKAYKLDTLTPADFSKSDT